MISQDSRANPQIAASAAVLGILAAGWLARAIQAAVAARGEVRLCLAGGRTPLPAYRTLAEMGGLPWSKVRIWLSDERCAPYEQGGSNAEAVAEALGGRPVELHRYEIGDPDREAAARRYAAGLPSRFDLVLLGVGEDGHIAGLFPGSPALDEARYAAPTQGPDGPRLTLTPAALGAAELGLVLVSGARKAEAVAAALTGPLDPALCPATLARRGQWLLDRDAASLLPRGFRIGR